jgi:hypothetical protein
MDIWKCNKCLPHGDEDAICILLDFAGVFNESDLLCVHDSHTEPGWVHIEDDDVIKSKIISAL